MISTYGQLDCFYIPYVKWLYSNRPGRSRKPRLPHMYGALLSRNWRINGIDSNLYPEKRRGLARGGKGGGNGASSDWCFFIVILGYREID